MQRKILIKCHLPDKVSKYDVSKSSKLIITIFCKNNNVGTKKSAGGKFSKNKEIPRCHERRAGSEGEREGELHENCFPRHRAPSSVI